MIKEEYQIKHGTKSYEIKTIEEMRVSNIRIGDFRDRITIQEKKSTSDNEGGFTDEWVNVSDIGDNGSLWAKVTSIKAEQQFEFNSVGVEATHRIEIRSPQGKFIITCREVR